MHRVAPVSIIIPVRNGLPHVVEAVASVMAEIGDADEIIVVDDASVDATSAVLNRCFPSVRLVTSPGDGPSSARNAGLREARNGLVAFLDHDDLWPPGRHAALRERLLSDGTADAAAGRLQLQVEERGRAGDLAGLDGRHAPSILMSCLYRRSLLDRVGPFDESLRFGEDLDYHLRLVDAGMRLSLVDTPALIYRRHAANATNGAPDRRTVLMSIMARRAARLRAGSGARDGGTPLPHG